MTTPVCRGERTVPPTDKATVAPVSRAPQSRESMRTSPGRTFLHAAEMGVFLKVNLPPARVPGKQDFAHRLPDERPQLGGVAVQPCGKLASGGTVTFRPSRTMGSPFQRCAMPASLKSIAICPSSLQEDAAVTTSTALRTGSASQWDTARLPWGLYWKAGNAYARRRTHPRRPPAPRARSRRSGPDGSAR